MESLCLSCSSSLPRKVDFFKAPCCGRSICQTCLKANPRLARYNPCLACLGGVQAVSARRSLSTNVDASVCDADTFVIGDEEGDEDESSSPSEVSARSAADSPAPHVDRLPANDEVVRAAEPSSSYYSIKRGDTLRGISFKLGVDAWELCKLNKLPFSTLNTTPHLLHTRTTLVLPSSIKAPSLDHLPNPNEDVDEEQRARRARERAAKRFQTLTKEVDWHVAKAYVAIADDPVVATTQAMKAKEMGDNFNSNLESMAVAQYLDDDEWERDQKAAGRLHRKT